MFFEQLKQPRPFFPETGQARQGFASYRISRASLTP